MTGSELKDEIARLKSIEAATKAFDPGVRGTVFARLLEVELAKGKSSAGAVAGAVVTGVCACAIALLWFDRDSPRWPRAWSWIQDGWWHWSLFALAIGLVVVGGSLLVISGTSPFGKIPGRLVAIIVGLSAVTAAVFAVYPNLVPATQVSFTVNDVRVEQAVTLREYTDTDHISYALAANQWAFPGPQAAEAAESGIVVDFNLDAQGLLGRPVGLQWVLFDAATNERVAQSDAESDPWCTYLVRPGPAPCLTFGADLKDRDTSSFGFWLSADQLMTRAGRTLGCGYVRVEAYLGPERLGYADSPQFSTSAAAGQRCAANDPG